MSMSWVQRETYKRDLEKRPTLRELQKNPLWVYALYEDVMHVKRNLQKRPAKETYKRALQRIETCKRDLQKSPTTCRDLQKRPTKEPYNV